MVSEFNISDILKDLGVTNNLLGYCYLKYAISKMIEDNSLMRGITKRLYPMIAEKFNTTASGVERAIRHAIEKGWERGNIQTQDKLFGFTIDVNKGKPTNSEFICCVADWVNMEAKNV